MCGSTSVCGAVDGTSTARWSLDVWRRTDDPAELRERMVAEQIEARGIRDSRVVAAMREVPRHRFVSENMVRSAYDDSALPIGGGQTISQPYMVALMTEALRLDPDKRLLEVGTGSGYQAALASRLCGEVWSVERVRELAETARAVLTDLDVHNVQVIVGDGSRGLPEQAPFDAIVVTAATERVPPALFEQLTMDERGAERRGVPAAVRVRVEGSVQGVFYRATTRQTALRLGLTGWVANRPDGSVEAFFQGPSAAVEAAVAWCREGPPGARVDRVEVEPAATDDRWTDFRVVA
jgi:protein-L-isoaspartate(D-aspartate) O-methyltransferase